MNRKYRKTVIAANWKMNMSLAEIKSFAEAYRSKGPKAKWCDVMIYAPSIYLQAAKRAFRSTRVIIGAENKSEKEKGAVTGEISAAMLEDVGINHTLAGHSERRSIYHESDFAINETLKTALAHKIAPTLCVGESLEQREAGAEKETIAYQLHVGLSGISAQQMRKVMIAYEPVWAIGTGRTATAEQAEEICEFIRTEIRKMYTARIARATTILYGGSVSPDNAKELFAQPDIDGGLIGGASLNPEKFIAIINASKQEA